MDIKCANEEKTFIYKKYLARKFIWQIMFSIKFYVYEPKSQLI